MKKPNLKKEGENVSKKFPSSQKSNEKNSISISSYDKKSSSSYNYPINKASKTVKKKRNSNNNIIGREIPLKKLGSIIKRKSSLKKFEEENINIDKSTIFSLYKKVKSLEEEQINTTKAIEKNSTVIQKNTKAIKEVKNEQMKTNALLSELVDFFKNGKDRNNKNEYSNKNNITNQDQRTQKSKEFENDSDKIIIDPSLMS